MVEDKTLVELAIRIVQTLIDRGVVDVPNDKISLMMLNDRLPPRRPPRPPHI